jgi:hypothetical protein
VNKFVFENGEEEEPLGTPVLRFEGGVIEVLKEIRHAGYIWLSIVSA